MNLRGDLNTYPNAGLAIGTGLTFTREPKPYQISTLFPFPSLRWGINLFMPTTRQIYGGGQAQMNFGRFGGWDSVTPLRKTRNGSTF